MASEMSVGASRPAMRPSWSLGELWRPTRATSSSTQLVGLAGLFCFDLIVVAALVGPPLWDAPGTTASGTQVAAYFQRDTGRITASLLIYCLAMGLFVCFAGGLWSWLREWESPPQTLSSIFAFGAVALTVLILAGFVPAYLLSYRTQPATVSRPLADLTFGLLAISGIPTAVCLAAYARLVSRLRCLPRWTAWLAAIAALTHVLIAASFISHGAFVSLESSVILWVPSTFFLWILATSTALVRLRPQLP